MLLLDHQIAAYHAVLWYTLVSKRSCHLLAVNVWYTVVSYLDSPVSFVDWNWLLGAENAGVDKKKKQEVPQVLSRIQGANEPKGKQSKSVSSNHVLPPLKKARAHQQPHV